MTKGLMIFYFVLALTTCTGQDQSKSRQIAACEKCSEDVISYTSNNEDSLSEGDIGAFLCSLGDECRNNVEFSETSNELLFYVIVHYPRLTLKSLTENKRIQRNFVIDQMSKPINDSIDLEGAVRSIESVEGYDALKKEALKSLRKAIDSLRK